MAINVFSDKRYFHRVEVLRSYLKATDDTVIKYYDITSLYPAVQAMR